MGFDIENVLYSLPAVIIGLTVHEYSHALMASKLGDSTAKDQGRITFNPLKHIDPLGMIFIIIAGFGWAKPVQFNRENLKNPRCDKALIALAGPISNLVLGIIFLIIIKIFLIIKYLVAGNLYMILMKEFFYIAVINLGLFIFNILPLPPLDGSHVFLSGINLTAETERKFMKFGSYALFALLIIENRANIDIIPIGKFTNFVVGLFFK